MNKLSDKILKKIKTEKVLPKPKWHFVLLHMLLILTMIISIAAGSIGVAIILRWANVSDWTLMTELSGGRIDKIINLLPYVWLIFIVITIVLADSLFKRTRRGHRFRSWLIVFVSIVLSLNFGYMFYLARFDEPVEAMIRQNMPYYEQWNDQKAHYFHKPEAGILMGKLIEMPTDERWVLRDFKQHVWQVNVDQAEYTLPFDPELGMRLGVFGQVRQKGEFEAFKIGLWEPHKPRFERRDR